MAQDGVIPAQVLTYVSDWVERHMAPDYQPDAVPPEEFAPFIQQISPQVDQDAGQQRPQQPHRYLQNPLHYQCIEIINNRPYFLQLEKRQHDFVLLHFTLACLDPSNQPDIIYDLVFHNYQSGNYSMILEIPEDCQYVTSMRFTRLSST